MMIDCAGCGRPSMWWWCDDCMMKSLRDAQTRADGIKPEPHDDDTKDALNYTTYAQKRDSDYQGRFIFTQVAWDPKTHK